MSTFTDEENEFAEGHPSLGADYKRASAIAERFMENFKDEHFKALADDFAEKFRDKLWSDISGWLVSDTECNLQTEIRQTVDGTVNAILTGKPWALNRYPLSQYHNGEDIRKAIFAQHQEAMENLRIAELEKEVERLTQQLEWHRR